MISPTTTTILSLPEELILQIFKFLPLNDLGRVSQVCKLWNKKCNEDSLWLVHKFFPQVRFIDVTMPKTLPLCGRANAIKIKKLLDQKKDGDPGVTILTIPKGLSIQKLADFLSSSDMSQQYIEAFNIQCSRNPKFNPEKSFCFNIDEKPLKDYLNISVPQTYVVALSNSTFQGSRQFSADDLSKFLKENESPTLLEILSLVYLTFPMSETEKTPVSLFQDTQTICVSPNDECLLLITNFDKFGSSIVLVNESIKYMWYSGIIMRLQLDDIRLKKNE